MISIWLLCVLASSVVASIVVRIAIVDLGVFGVAQDDYITVLTAHGSLLVFFIIPVLYGPVLWNDDEQPLDPEISDQDSVCIALSVWSFLIGPLGLGSGSGWTMYAPVFFGQESSVFGSFDTLCGLLSNLMGLEVGDDDDEENQISYDILYYRGAALVDTYILILTPILIALLVVTALDQYCCWHSFNYPLGSPYLFQEIFWVFGHPEVYFLALPILVFANMIRGVFVFRSTPPMRRSRSVIQIERVFLLSAVVWGHHLIAVFLSLPFRWFFILSSLYIMYPMFLNAFLLRSVFEYGLRTKMPVFGGVLFARVFRFGIFFFLAGGLTALLFISSSGLTLHGTRYVVGHFHFFMAGTVAFMTILVVKSMSMCDICGEILSFSFRHRLNRVYSSLFAAAVFVAVTFINISIFGGSRRAGLWVSVFGSGRKIVATCFILPVTLYFLFYLLQIFAGSSAGTALGGGTWLRNFKFIQIRSRVVGGKYSRRRSCKFATKRRLMRRSVFSRLVGALLAFKRHGLTSDISSSTASRLKVTRPIRISAALRRHIFVLRGVRSVLGRSRMIDRRACFKSSIRRNFIRVTRSTGY